MKKILVTGAAGFIGARLTEYLLNDGKKVVGVDNFSNYYDPRLKYYRIEQFKKHKEFTLVEVDITDQESMESVFANSEYSAVIHLAGMAGVRRSKERPLEYEKINVAGTALLLELTRKYHIPTFIFASTSSVYAGNVPPFQEDMRTDTPSSIYAATKKSAETLIHSYNNLFNINCVILRYFSVYGPQGRPDMCYFRFIRDINENRPIHIYGDGTQKRDFTYVDDIVNGTISALDLKGMHVCNLAHGESVYSINRLIEIIESNLKKKALKVYEDSDSSDLPITKADTTRAQKMLSWTPTMQFEDGVTKTIEWHLANKSFVQGLLND